MTKETLKKVAVQVEEVVREAVKMARNNNLKNHNEETPKSEHHQQILNSIDCVIGAEYLAGAAKVIQEQANSLTVQATIPLTYALKCLGESHTIVTFHARERMWTLDRTAHRVLRCDERDVLVFEEEK